MSNRERLMKLIDDMSENKLAFVVSIIGAVRGYAGEGIISDKWEDGQDISPHELYENSLKV